MPKYEVIAEATFSCCIEVDAINEEEARKKADKELELDDSYLAFSTMTPRKYWRVQEF